jgi:hypothetical protein
VSRLEVVDFVGIVKVLERFLSIDLGCSLQLWYRILRGFFEGILRFFVVLLGVLLVEVGQAFWEIFIEL